MTHNQQIFDEQLLQEASDWWTRLRDPHGAEATVEQWLEWAEQDERHLAAFEHVNAFGERLGKLDADMRNQLLREFAPAVVSTGMPSQRKWLAVAAAAVLVLSVSGFLLRVRAPDEGELQASYQSDTGQNRDITLADGSKVTLGGASRIDVRFADGRRRVTLETGEAYFQVVHDAQHPFEVAAGGITVHDIGTAFDVRRTAGEVTVAVTQGQVRVTTAGDAAHTMDAGAEQRVVWNATTQVLNLGTTTLEQATGWRSNRLEFVDEPLPVVIASINRYSSKPVRISGTGLAGLSFTGTVHAGDINGWLHALPQVFPLQVDMGANAITLSADNTGVQRR